MDVTDAMHRQARALADPSRFKLFSYIANTGGSVGVAELTDLLGFNHNAIRQHLTVLVDAGLVTETVEDRKIRGRPRNEYRLRRDALSAFASVAGSYKQLAELLIDVAVSDEDTYEVGLRSGRATALNGAGDVVGATAAMTLRLAEEGFEPDQHGDGPITLTHCPFADLATENPSIVCELHRGMVDGVLAEQRPAMRGSLKPGDPNRPDCTVTVHLVDSSPD